MKYKNVIAILMVGTALAACSKVEPGYVGVKVHTMGSGTGVDSDVLGPRWYYTGLFTSIYEFPTFTQNVNWTSENNDAIKFSDNQGMNLVADIGISYHVDPNKAPKLFQKYRKGIDEITDIYLHNMVRDAFNDEGSKHSVDWIYAEGKPIIIRKVQEEVSKQVTQYGIIIEKLYWTGNGLVLPPQIQKSINLKQQAIQQAQQRENEVKTAQAQAQIEVAKAQGDGQAILTKAQAQAEANKILAASLTAELVQYKMIEKWSGDVPKVTGTQGTFLQLPLNTTK